MHMRSSCLWRVFGVFGALYNFCVFPPIHNGVNDSVVFDVTFLLSSGIWYAKSKNL